MKIQRSVRKFIVEYNNKSINIIFYLLKHKQNKEGDKNYLI